jgi:4-amino-4-deoxy-L-arabinose transferase-like glycosyltransferase
MQKKKLSIDVFLVAAVISGLIFRLILWKAFRQTISFDSANYLRLAGHSLANGWASLAHPYWSPAFPFMVRILTVFTGDLESAGRWVGILSGTGLVALTYFFALRLFGRPEARLTAFLLALFPPLAFESSAAMPEPLFALAGLSGIWFAWRLLQSHQWIYGIFAGLCWGLTYLTKPEGLGFLMVFIIFASLWTVMSRKILRTRDITFSVAVVLAAFLIIASPYLIYLRKATGEWTISTKGFVNQQMEAAVMFNNGPVQDPQFYLTPDLEHLPYDMGLHFGTFNELRTLSGGSDRLIRISPEQYLVKYIKNMDQLTQESIPRLFGLLLLVLLILGFFSSVYTGRKKYLLFILMFIGFFWFIVIPLFHINTRYLTPLLPLAFIWIGVGSRICHQWIRQFFISSMKKDELNRMVSAALMAGILIVFTFIPECGRIQAVSRPGPELWGQPLELKMAGEWLKSRSSDTPVRLMTLNKAVDYYAGQYDMKQGASFSLDPVEKNITYARHRGCEYMVFSSRYLSWFVNLKPLVENTDLAGLDRVYDMTDRFGIRTVIYKIRTEPS